jgi:phenylacetate-coenzyme A ligase PaaK-like adenylate-forming protein
VRRFAVVDEFQIEVFRRGMLDEVRLVLEIDGGAGPAESVQATVDRVAEAVRRDLGIRVEVAAVPVRTLPRYELKARRVVRREEPGC